MSEREFVVINEEAARTAQNMMSFNEYQPGSRTKEYQEDVNEVYDLAEEVVTRRGEEYRERAWRLATRYAKNLGKYFNEEARIGYTYLTLEDIVCAVIFPKAFIAAPTLILLSGSTFCIHEYKTHIKITYKTFIQNSF